MSVYERKDSPFYWMYLEGSGQQQRSTGIRCDATAPAVRKANRAAADAIYHAAMTALAKGRAGLPIDSKETFQTFSDWYEAHKISKHKGKDRERTILEVHLRPYFGAMLLGDIRPRVWIEYETKRLKDGIVQNTVGRELALMKSILESAVGEYLELNPLGGVKRKTTKILPKRTITADEEKRLLKEITDPEIRDLYLVGVGTLLRQQNLVDLRRNQWRNGELVTMTKTGPHAIDLSGPTDLQRRVALVLANRMPSRPDGFFFPIWQARFAKRDKSENQRAGNSKFLQAIRRACKRANIPWGLEQQGLVWHTLTRASGATRLMREHGIDIATVQHLGNWTSLDQMSAYLGLDLTKIAAAAPSAAPSAGPKLLTPRLVKRQRTQDA